MKKVSMMVAVLLLAFGLIACGKKEPSEVEITLASNPTTGYVWELTEDKDEVLKFEEMEEDYDTDEDAVGTAGSESYQFVAKTAGEATIVFEYLRPWEDGEKAYRVTYDFKVDKDLQVEFVNKKIEILDESVETEAELDKKLKDPVID